MTEQGAEMCANVPQKSTLLVMSHDDLTLL